MQSRDSLRLLDAASVAPVIEALDAGRDGFPRSIVLDVPHSSQGARILERLRAAADERGYVALSVAAFRSLERARRSDLRERTLFLEGDASCGAVGAHAALMEAVSQSPRPHLLVLLRAATAEQPGTVREARPAFGPRPRVVISPGVERHIDRASRATNFVAAGRHAAAERLLRDVTASLLRRRALADAARIAVELAQLLADRGRPGAAFDTYAEAALYAQDGGDEHLAIQARLGQAAVRIADAALVDAEALCRAALVAPRLTSAARMRAQTLLAWALLWQRRVGEVPDVDFGEAADADPRVVGEALEAAIRTCLARGDIFAAGQRVERLRLAAAARSDPYLDTIATACDLGVVAASGDVARARQAFAVAASAARRARLPLRVSWARIEWLDMLRRAGLGDEAGAQLRILQRSARAAPKLQVREIEYRVSSPQVAAANRPREIAVASALSTGLVRLAQEADDDEEAVRRLLQRMAVELQATRVDLLSRDAGPASVLVAIGDGLATRIGARVLDTVFAIGPECEGGGCEVGVPVRLGSRLVGAVVCRWSIDRAVPPGSMEILDLTAAVIAPRLDAWIAARRDESRAAVVVPELIGASAAMSEVRTAVVRAAAAPFNVLIEGESGVGKELAARALHYLSPRRERRFCDINCAALPDELLESELFGHARGSFSGAVAERAGFFEEADGGTLLLDEIADLSLRAQAKLLRAIQQQEIRRVGESFSRAIDVRIVAAANRDMRAQVAAGRFRQDLLYRVDVVRICIPPLRERPDDIPALAAHCWQLAAARVGSQAQLLPAVITALTHYHWPGNVRELQNVIASLAVAAPRSGWVRPSLLAPVIAARPGDVSPRLSEARAQFERRLIEATLAGAGGNRARAARSLGVSRQGLLKTMARLGLETSRVKA